MPERRRRGEGDASSFPLPTSFCGVPLCDCGDEARFGDGELESVSRSAVSACDGRCWPAESGRAMPEASAQRPLHRSDRTSTPVPAVAAAVRRPPAAQWRGKDGDHPGRSTFPTTNGQFRQKSKKQSRVISILIETIAVLMRHGNTNNYEC